MEKQKSDVQKWLTTIASYEKEFKKWQTRAEKIVKIYRDHDNQAETTGNSTATFNILWSNVQTCLPATFARLPKPDVSRRFRDNDPVGRVASMILERALEFEIEHYPDYRAAMENSVLDRFLGGRGVSWVRYEPHFKAAEQGMPEDGLQVTDDANESEDTPEAQEVIDYECAPVDYVHWKDFGHSIARTWEEVTEVWRKVYMQRPALVERFGEELGNKIPLDTRPDDQKKSAGDDTYQACIYEIWSKSTNKAIWLSKSMNEILDERDDPLHLESFYPCPRPLFATLTTDSLIPVPDYKLYQDQAKELNVLADRIDGLINALKVRGVYDASIAELGRLFTEGENNTLIPVKNWSAFAEKQGLKGAIDLVDIAPIAAALAEAYKSVDQVKNQIYEIMGIADILRGSTDPNETAKAQQIKGQFGGMRLRSMQSKVGQFATDILQIKAQIMCKFFQPETLIKISAAMQMSPADQQMIPQALQMLKDEPLRNFRIEVTADSMTQMDEQQEKQDRMEFLTATGAFLREALPVIQETPQIAPLLIDLMKFGVTGFKVGKSIEGSFDEAIDQLKQQAANPTPKPNPEMQKIQAQASVDQQAMQQKAQLDQQVEMGRQQFEGHKLQMEAAQKQQQAQLDAQVEQSKQAAQAQQSQHQNELEAQRAELDAQRKHQLEQQRMASEERQVQAKIEFDRWKTEMESQTKIVVAELAAKTSLKQTAMSTNAKELSDSPMEAGDDGSMSPKLSLSGLVDTVNQALQSAMDSGKSTVETVSGMLQQHQAAMDQKHAEVIDAVSKPKPRTLQRDPKTNKVISVDGRSVVRDASGRAVGIE